MIKYLRRLAPCPVCASVTCTDCDLKNSAHFRHECWWFVHNVSRTIAHILQFAKIATAFRYNHHAKQLTTTSSLLWHFDVSALTALLRSHQNIGAFNSSLTCAVLAAHHRRQCSARWTNFASWTALWRHPFKTWRTKLFHGMTNR